MFNSWKSSFRPVGKGQRQDGSEAGDDNGASSRLKSTIADLKASDAEYEARLAAAMNGDAVDVTIATLGNGKSRPDLSAPAPTAVASAPAAPATPVMTALLAPSAVAAAPEATDDALTAAQNLVVKQRQAAEELLREACALEDRLKGEASAAQAARESAALREKAEGALLLERQAQELNRAATQRHNALAAERKAAEDLVAATRAGAEAAKIAIAELQQRLAETRRAADEAASSIGAHEARARDCAAKEAAAKREAAEAAARVAACQSARAAAEKQAKTAQERAEALKKALPEVPQSFAGIDDVKSLAARIAQQASVLKDGVRPGAH